VPPFLIRLVDGFLLRAVAQGVVVGMATEAGQTLQRLPDSPTFQYEIAGETNFENMRLKYGNDWEVLVKFQGLPSGATQNNMKVNWNFARTSDMNVERMLVVPEPTTLFVCVAGLLTMAAYRPRRAA